MFPALSDPWVLMNFKFYLGSATLALHQNEITHTTTRLTFSPFACGYTHWLSLILPFDHGSFCRFSSTAHLSSRAPPNLSEVRLMEVLNSTSWRSVNALLRHRSPSPEISGCGSSRHGDRKLFNILGAPDVATWPKTFASVS